MAHPKGTLGQMIIQINSLSFIADHVLSIILLKRWIIYHILNYLIDLNGLLSLELLIYICVCVRVCVFACACI